MIDYKIVIPTYQRYDLAKKKTLAFLQSHNIPKDRIYVFVANEEEKEKYQETIGEYTIVVGVKGIGQQRNFIEQEWAQEGEYIISMDDDIENVMIKDGENTMSPIKNFYDDLILRGYDEMQKNKAKTWGIYAAANPFFMKYRVYTDLSYIIASTYGFIATKNEKLKRITEHGEDYEYSIRQYVLNKKLVRFDWITVKTKYFHIGGLEEHRKENNTNVEDGINKIVELFPQYCTKYYRKNGTPELRLKDKTKKQKKKPIIERDVERPWIKL